MYEETPIPTPFTGCDVFINGEKVRADIVDYQPPEPDVGLMTPEYGIELRNMRGERVAWLEQELNDPDVLASVREQINDAMENYNPY